MIALLINLLILCLVFGLIWWVISLIPLPAPFKLGAQIIIAILAIIVLLGFVGWVPGWQIHGYRGGVR